MPTLDDAYAQLWHAINPSVALNPGSGLYTAWRDNYSAWGSPINDEFADDSGTPTQVFAHAIVQWTPNGAVVVGQ